MFFRDGHGTHRLQKGHQHREKWGKRVSNLLRLEVHMERVDKLMQQVL